MNNTTAPASLYECPGLSDWEDQLIANLGYYVEGVLILITSIFGIAINLVSSIVILTRHEMRNCFNILLVALAGYDSWYLIGAVLESCRKYFPSLRSETAIHLFPYFLYPAHQTSIAGSIFMTVAIAFERYAAVHYPLDYNQVSTGSSQWFFFILNKVELAKTFEPRITNRIKKKKKKRKKKLKKIDESNRIA